MSEMPVLYRAMTTPHCQQRHTSRPPVWGRKRKVKRVPGLCPATMIVNIPTVGEREREKGYKQQSETAGPEFTFRRRPRRSVVVCSTRRTGIFIPKLARTRQQKNTKEYGRAIPRWRQSVSVRPGTFLLKLFRNARLACFWAVGVILTRHRSPVPN